MSHSTAAGVADAPDHADDFWRALIHRWFVHYNPMYLASALLALLGLRMVSCGLVEQGSQRGLLGVALLAEVYAWSLVGGAALLMRVGQRRPAVWLALLALVYQWDLTLHTQTCAALGLVGLAPAAIWLASFVGKLVALAAAMRVQIAPRALGAATLAATGLAVLPFALFRLDPATLGNAMALFVFGLGACLPRQLGASTIARGPLDTWGQTVLRRVNVAAWAIGGAFVAMHVVFWWVETAYDLWRVAVVLAVLVSVRTLDEGAVWLAATGALILTALVGPRHFAAIASIWALALVLRAFSDRRQAAPVRPVSEATAPAYRGTPVEPAAPTAPRELFMPVSPAERLRLLTGALATGYLALWTNGWHGGGLPAHALLLDLTLVAFGLLMAWRLGARIVLVVMATALTHAALSAGLVPAPRSLVDWGAALLALGFGLLFVSLAISYRLRATAARPAGPPRARARARA